MSKYIQGVLREVVRIEENSWEDKRHIYQAKQTIFLNDEDKECELSEVRVWDKQNILDVVLGKMRYVETHYVDRKQIYGELGYIKGNQKNIQFNSSF